MRQCGARATVVALAGVMTMAWPVPAQAQAQTSRERAEDALDRVQQLVRGVGVETGRELTPALLELQRSRRALPARDRGQAAGYFARPTDMAPGDEFAYQVAEEPPLCGTSFCIHYVGSGVDAPDMTDAGGDPAPDYVETMLAVFESEVLPCENGTAAGACGLDAAGVNGTLPGQGWRRPPADGTLGGDARMDVYIAELGNRPAGGLYGAVVPDDGQTGPVQTAWQIMDDDYDPSEFSGSSGMAALRVTAAHEFHHAVQLAYDARVDSWMFEATATYLEDLVYPGVNDYFQYLTDWTPLAAQDRPMAAEDDTDLKRYATAVWTQWLHARFGPGAVRRAWEVSPAPAGGRPASFAAGAYDQAVSEAGGGSFGEEFARFSTAMAEWRLPGSGFRDLFADMEREGTLPVDGPGVAVPMNHTTFALFDVPRTSAASITLAGSAPAGTVAALALVGRTGPDTAGASAQRLTMLPAGGSGRVELPDAPTFDRITAVVINADASLSGGAPGAWSYARNGQTFTAAVTTTPPPPPPPPAPPPEPQPAADTTPPRVRIALGRQRLRTVLRTGLRVPVTCDEPCTITATTTLPSRDARRLRLRGTLARSTGRRTTPGTARLRVKLNRAARSRLARRRTVKLSLAVRVADAAGNATTVRRTVTLRR